ncbi:MAG: iron-sulfur cluster repair di-iron protein [Candidatus Sumerlaeia bacterium]
MTAITEKTVAELVAESPARARVFEAYGIDYCCNGNRILREACTGADVELDEVVRALNQADAALSPEAKDVDWRGRTMSELVDNIVETHHAFLLKELPRLEQLVFKVADTHGERHPELRETARVYAGLQDELYQHMMKEEQILFPWIKAAEAGEAGPFHCGTVQGPISVMEHEHDNAAGALARMRALTNDYTLPDDACQSCRELFDGLKRLESDLHMHIHKENNILFPRALEAERAMASQIPLDRPAF